MLQVLEDDFLPSELLLSEEDTEVKTLGLINKVKLFTNDSGHGPFTQPSACKTGSKDDTSTKISHLNLLISVMRTSW